MFFYIETDEGIKVNSLIIFVATLDGKIHNGFRPVNPLHKNHVYQ